MTVTRLDVVGDPAPKGSARAINVKGRARLVPSGSDHARTELRSWTTEVTIAAQDRAGNGGRIEGPVSVTMVFYLRRPNSRRKAGHADRKPDLDKLARSTADALVAGRIIEDDARIVTWHLAKQYADERPPGAHITIRPAP